MRYSAFVLIVGVLVLTGCATLQEEQNTTIVQSSTLQAQEPSPEAQILKKKIAVGRFTNDTRMANSFLTEGDDNPEKLSRAATDILSTKLVQSNRFLIIERQDSLAINAELRVSNIDSYRIPADYLILGSISEFGRNTSGNVGLIDRTKKQTAYAKVNLRIVDTRTGMVIFGEEGTGEATNEVGSVLGMGSQAGYDDTLTDKAIDAAISSVINNLINKLNNDPWISYILSVDNDRLFISGGALQGIKTGDSFTIYQRGKTVTNPQTNVPIELPGTAVAKIVIMDVIPGSELTEISVAKFVEGSIISSDLTNYYISNK